MAELEKLAEKMASQGIVRAVLVANQAARLYTADGRQGSGPNFSTEQIEAIVREAAPGRLLSQTLDDGQFGFPYEAGAGLMTVRVRLENQRLLVEVAPSSQTAAHSTTGARAPQPVPASPESQHAETRTGWHYAVGEIRLGPVDDATLAQLTASGHITGDTLVWREGMPDWAQAKLTDLDFQPPAQQSRPRRLWGPPPGSGPCDGSGLGEYSFPLPEELKGFNWGAALTPVFWGIGNNTWSALWFMAVAALPWTFGLIASLYGASGFASWLGIFTRVVSLSAIVVFLLRLGLRGNDFAWRNRQWSSIEQFRRVQKFWAFCGVALTVAWLLFHFMFVAVTTR
jgi:hypothetical protein